MTVPEALTIVLELARANIAPKEGNPQAHQEETDACDIIEDFLNHLDE